MNPIGFTRGSTLAGSSATPSGLLIQYMLYALSPSNEAYRQMMP